MPRQSTQNTFIDRQKPFRRRMTHRAAIATVATVATAVLGAGIAPFAHAQNASAVAPAEAASAGAASEKLSPADQQFIDEAGQAGATEIAASKLAIAKTGDPQVKRFAQRMVADHTRLARNLDVVAKRHGITAPASADSSAIGSLQNLQGTEFDKAYIEKMLEGHKKAVELFRKESESGQDALLKASAAKALPIITHHYAMVQQLAKAKAASS